MKNVEIIQDRDKPWGYQIKLNIGGVTFESRSIHSIQEVRNKGFNIARRLDWVDGKGHVEVEADAK